MQKATWDETGYIATADGDNFFKSWAEIKEFCKEQKIELKDLKLVICDAIGVPPINIAHHCQMPLDEIPIMIVKAAEVLNHVISKENPIDFEITDMEVAIPQDI